MYLLVNYPPQFTVYHPVRRVRSTDGEVGVRWSVRIEQRSWRVEEGSRRTEEGKMEAGEASKGKVGRRKRASG